MVLLSGVEIFAAGIQTDSSGFTADFTVEELDTIVERFNSGAPEYVPVKLGHTSDEHNADIARELAARLDVPEKGLLGENGGQDGVLSLGRVVGLRRVQDKLVADFDVPVAMKDLVDRQFLRDVSVEMVGQTGDWTLTAVAWLGAELPAVKDLNGLAAAATLRQQQAGPVLAFKSKAIVPVNGKEQKMSLKDKLANLFKDSDDEEIKALFAEDEDEDEDVEMEDDTAVVAPITGEQAAAIKAILGVGMDAEGDEILDALRNAVGLPSNAPVEEVVPVMKARIAKKPVKFSETAEYKTMASEIASLKRDGRLAFYKAETSGLLIQGKDEDLAEKLVGIEEASGAEVAGELLASWKRESESNRRYTQASGATGDATTVVEHEFEDTIKAYMAENKVNRRVALARLALNAETSDDFNKWRRDISRAEA